MRRMMVLAEAGYAMHEKSSVTKEEGMGTFHWVRWLLDQLENHHAPQQEKPHINQKDWKPKSRILIFRETPKIAVFKAFFCR